MKNIIAQFKSYSLTKKIVVIFLIMMVAGSINRAFEESSPEWQQANQRNKDAFIAQQAADRKLHAELQGRDCTKDGNALIGEEPDRTLKCGWGKPLKINRTTLGNGYVREQWVYGNGNNLYFVNGKLEGIQN